MTVIPFEGGKRIEQVRGDITLETTDAIVNAANGELLPGGGVCGAIHRAGGPSIAAECREIRARRGSLADGEVAITRAGNLPCSFVIHAVGPVWGGGDQGEPEAPAKCYHASICLADEHQLSSIAFPAISTGIFGYPIELAARVALAASAEALRVARSVRQVRFVLFDDRVLGVFQKASRGLGAT